MKRHNDMPIKDVLNQLVHQKKFEKGIFDAKIKQIWEEDLGKLVQSQTEKIWFSNGTVYIKLNSAPLRNQLMMGKAQMIENMNKLLGEEVVSEIKYI